MGRKGHLRKHRVTGGIDLPVGVYAWVMRGRRRRRRREWGGEKGRVCLLEFYIHAGATPTLFTILPTVSNRAITVVRVLAVHAYPAILASGSCTVIDLWTRKREPACELCHLVCQREQNPIVKMSIFCWSFLQNLEIICTTLFQRNNAEKLLKLSRQCVVLYSMPVEPVFWNWSPNFAVKRRNTCRFCETARNIVSITNVILEKNNTTAQCTCTDTIIIQIFGALKFRCGGITQRSVYFKFLCRRMLSWSLKVFSHSGIFLISVKPLTTENSENKTTPKICKKMTVYVLLGAQTQLFLS